MRSADTSKVYPGYTSKRSYIGDMGKTFGSNGSAIGSSRHVSANDFTGALRAPAVFDSGLTLEQIDAILEQLIDELARSELGRDAGLIVGLEVGLLSGDVVQTSQAGMVMLPEPWSVINARLQTVRNAVARGASLNEAIELANRPDAPRRA